VEGDAIGAELGDLKGREGEADEGPEREPGTDPASNDALPTPFLIRGVAGREPIGGRPGRIASVRLALRG
jgi:hypothetical protein